MNRLHQSILIVSTILGSWLGMQAVHESGHVLGAWLTGGRVERVVLNPLTISRTDLSANPSPLLVVWAGPVFGVVFPVILWGITAAARIRGAFVLRFFAGFCFLANGSYIAIGSLSHAGDCGEMLRHGSGPWQLWLFGAVTGPIGLWLWHRQGIHFGLGKDASASIQPAVAYGSLVVCLSLLLFGLIVGGE